MSRLWLALVQWWPATRSGAGRTDSAFFLSFDRSIYNCAGAGKRWSCLAQGRYRSHGYEGGTCAPCWQRALDWVQLSARARTGAPGSLVWRPSPHWRAG